MERLALAKAVVAGRIPPIRSTDAAQRPTALFYPGLPGRHFYDPNEFAWAAELRSHFAAISAELDATLHARRGFEPIFPAHSDSGHWAGLWFYLYGRRYDANCASFPRTLKALAQVPRAAGWACLSAMAPGSHVTAHCGATNAKLRLHFSLRSDEGSMMRVADDYYEWRQGEIMIFDDSYEHEVWVAGQSPRVVLIVDFYHPDLTDEEVAFLTEFETLPTPLTRNRSLRELYTNAAATFGGDPRAVSPDWLYDAENQRTPATD